MEGHFFDFPGDGFVHCLCKVANMVVAQQINIIAININSLHGIINLKIIGYDFIIKF